jgi:glycosyltransferase involved in cell wall biosynthesis
MASNVYHQSHPGITVAIPVYNEAQILVQNTERLLAYLATLHVPYEVLIGSNGSTDATIELGQQLQNRRPHVTFFHVPDRGVGRAFRQFVERAKYAVLISLDMDLSADITFIGHVVALGTGVDIVIGSKKLADQRRPIVRKVGSDSFLWFARLLTGLPYDDYSIGAKAYRVQFLKEFAVCIGDGSSYVLDLCFAASRRRKIILCVPVACEDQRPSKFNLLDEALYKFSRLFLLWLKISVRAARSRHESVASQPPAPSPIK